MLRRIPIRVEGVHAPDEVAASTEPAYVALVTLIAGERLVHGASVTDIDDTVRLLRCSGDRRAIGLAHTTTKRVSPLPCRDSEPDPVPGPPKGEPQLLAAVNFTIALLVKRGSGALILCYKCQLTECQVAELLKMEVGPVQNASPVGC